MSVLDPILEPVRRLSLKGGNVLRAALPPVAVEVTADEIVLVRVKRKGAGRLELESAQARPLTAQLPGGMRGPVASEELAARLSELFASAKAKPGRLSLVLPDSLAKVTLIQLPERPSSARQLDEIVRFKLRKAVPFRLDEAALAWQLLPGAPPEVTVLVAAMPRVALEPYERALASIGARPGLVSLCTPNVFNLWKARMAQQAAGGDVALLNCTPAYFSLLIVRDERLIFYRCKPLAAGEEGGEAPERVLPRELASSLSYYKDKLGGSSLPVVYVRTVSQPYEELVVALDALGVGRVELVDPTLVLGPAGAAAGSAAGNGATLDPETAQRIAPSLGAASGWR